MKKLANLIFALFTLCTCSQAQNLSYVEFYEIDDIGAIATSYTPCPDLFLEAALSNINCFGACDVSIEILEVVLGVEPFVYEWSNGSTESAIHDLCAGEYSVTVTDANACVVSETFQIFQPEELLANATSTNETAEGANDGTASSSPTGGIEPYTYEWSNGITNAMITNLTAGSYTVVVTDANFCTDTQAVVVNAFGCVLSLESAVDPASCFESCDGSIVITPVNAVPPVSYNWNNGSTDSLIGNLCTGSYSVTIEDAMACTFTAGFEVSAPEQLLANAASADESAPGANDGSAWVAPSGGTAPYTYVWSNGSVDSLITDLIPGEYAVIVIDANGCVNPQTVVVNVFACVSLFEAALANATCFGSCDGAISLIIVGVVGPFTFAWSNGDTTASLQDICAGSYTLTVVDQGLNCSSTFSFEIHEPDPLIVVIDEVTHITDSTESSVSISVSGSTPLYTYTWSGPNGFVSSEEDIVGVDAGLYAVIVADANGCVASVDSIEIRDETVGISIFQALDVRVYPNPTSGLVYLDVFDATEFNIQLRNMDGRIMETWETTNTIDVTAYPEGVYVLRCTSGHKQFVFRLIISAN